MDIQDIAKSTRARVVHFSKITFMEHLYDILVGFFHGLLNLRTKSDLPKFYKERLENSVNSALYDLKYHLLIGEYSTKEEADKISQMDDFQLQALQTIAQSNYEKTQKDIDELKKTELYGEDDFKAEYEEKRTRYKQWEAALGRPPVYSLFDFRKYFAFNQDKVGSVATDKSDNQKTISPSERLSAFLIKIFLKFFPIVAIPLEVIFTVPAFNILSNGNNMATYAGAIVMIGCIYLLGEKCANCFMRSIESRVAVNESSKSPYIASKINRKFLILTIATFTLSVFIILVGARLRSIVYDINLAEKNIELSLNENGTFEEQTNFTQLRAPIDALRKEPFNLWFIEGIFSFGIYFVLFSASFFRTLLCHDSYLEYGIIQREVDQLYQAKRTLQIYKFADIKHVEEKLESHKQEKELYEREIAKRSAQKDKQNPSDGLKEVKDISIQTFNSYAISWVETRYTTYRRYFRIFCLFNDLPTPLNTLKKGSTS